MQRTPALNLQVTSKAAGWLVLTCLLNVAATEDGGGPELGSIKLTGIINLPDRKCAVLQTRGTRFQWPDLILAERQRDGRVEMLNIDPQAGKVTISFSVRGQATNQDLLLSSQATDRPNATISTLMLENVSINSVLTLYAEFSERSILRPVLPDMTMTLTDSPANKAEAAVALERALAAKEIVSIPDGTKFVMVVPKAFAALVRPHSSEIKSATDAGPTAPAGDNQLLARQSPDDNNIPPGVIHFVNVDLLDVATLYAELLGRKLDRTPPYPVHGLISFKSQTSLTKAEVCYALETLFSWQGAKLVPVGTNLMRLEPISSPLPDK
jgi:hypothetical protein